MPDKYSTNGYPGEFELLVLLAIARLGANAYGVTIRDELERETSRTLDLGSIYKTLGRLDGKGLLRARIGAPTAERGGRRKKLYELSATGRAVMTRSLADVRSLARGLDPETETR